MRHGRARRQALGTLAGLLGGVPVAHLLCGLGRFGKRR